MSSRGTRHKAAAPLSFTMDVIAEGVETQAQFACLINHGCQALCLHVRSRSKS